MEYSIRKAKASTTFIFAAVAAIALVAIALAPQTSYAAGLATGAVTSEQAASVNTQSVRWIDIVSPLEDATEYVISPSGDTSGATDRQALNNVMGIATTYSLDWNHQNKAITIRLKEGGQYYIDGTIKLFDNITVIGTGATVTQVTDGKPIFISAYYKDSPVNKGAMKNVKGYNRCKNITIIGGTYITTGKPAKDAKKGKYGKYKHGYSCFSFMHAQNINISDVTIKNNYNGHFIEFAGVKNSTISNCTLTGKYKGDDTNEAIQLDTCYNASVSPQGKPWDGTPCTNVTIQNCTINVPKMSVGIGTNFQCKKKTTKIKILANTIKVKKHAVALYKCKNITVKNNRFLKGTLMKGDGAAKVKASGNSKK